MRPEDGVAVDDVDEVEVRPEDGVAVDDVEEVDACWLADMVLVH